MHESAVSFERPELEFADLTHAEETVSRLRPLVADAPDERARAGPRSALLVGPNGNGKRDLARAVAGELGVPYGVVQPASGLALDPVPGITPDVVESVRSESPCVLGVEQVDAFAPSSGMGGSPYRLRAVDVFVECVEELLDAGATVVATANELDRIHWRVRRPATFDLLCPVGNPDADRLAAVLDRALSSVPVPVERDDDERADLLADLDGLSAADVRAAVRRAVGSSRADGAGPLAYADVGDAADRLRADVRADAGSGDSDLFAVDDPGADSIYRYQDHRSTDDGDDEETTEFTWGLHDDEDDENVSPAVQQGIAVPDVGYDDVGGLDDAKRTLREAIEWPRRYPELCERMDVDTARGILLHGPPGNGKTMLAKAIANETESHFISVKGPEVMDKFVGESQRFVAELFEVAREVAPSVVFVDEIDAITDERGADTVSDEVVNQLLLELDGMETLSDVVVVGATNRPDIIDDALRRPGRFGTELHVPQPDAEARRDIFRVHLRDRPTAEAVSLDWVVEQSNDGLSGADVAAICERAARNALRRSVHGDGDEAVWAGEEQAADGDNSPAADDAPEIRRVDLEDAFEKFEARDGLEADAGFQ